MLSTGCGEIKNGNTNKPIVYQTFWRDLLGMHKTDEVFLNTHKNIIKPAFDLADEFYAEIAPIVKAKPKDMYEQEARIIEAKYLPRAKELQQAIAQEEIMRKNDGMMFYGKRHIDNFTDRLEKTVAIPKAQAKDKQKLINYIVWHDRTRFKDNFYAYNHEWCLLTSGKGTYEVSTDSYRKIRKGMSYEQIRDILKMPGRFLVGTTVINKQSKKEWHVPVIWVQGNSYIYVEFINRHAANMHIWPYDGWKSPRN